MTQIHHSLINDSHSELLLNVFKDYSDDFEFTANGVFRRILPPLCPDCSTRMVHNGFNTRRKKHLGAVNIGRYLCPVCRKTITEDSSFWDKLTGSFFDTVAEICQILKTHHVSYEGMESLFRFIIPLSKDTIRNMVTYATKRMVVPLVNNILIIHYDEQHPKAGRNQMYRLTILDHITKQVIADELFDSKEGDVIKNFLERHLDTSKPIFIVTDLYRGYRKIFKDVFGTKVTHQLCLLHLNKLIVSDFPKKSTIEQELLKYELLDIFYNRELEIEFLRCIIGEEQAMKLGGEGDYKEWLRKAKSSFRNFVHSLELRRRRNKQNLEQRTYHDALNNLNQLLDRIDSFDIPVQKRLMKIKELWPNLTAFYFVDGAPATNNDLENYYSTSLKTHRKKQLQTQGIEEQMKLSALKRAGMFGRPQKTLIEKFLMFLPFRDPG